MNETAKSAEFEVGFVEFDDSKVVVSGRNYEQDISVGDVFRWVYRVTSEHLGGEYYHRHSDERAVTLRIETIEAYRQETDMLSIGMSGRLILTGEGANDLKPALRGKPSFYDLLRTERYIMSLRPSGLAEGEFLVPDDFDDPLPDDLQQLFEGHEESRS